MNAPIFSRADKSVLGQWWWTVDRGLLAALMTLIAFGVVLVAAASPAVADRVGLNQYHFIVRHLVFLGPALFIMIGISMLEPKMVRRVSNVVFVGAVLAMLLVLLIGSEVKGAQRWLSLMGFSLQPSEFVKPAFAVTAAWFMARQKEELGFPGNKVAAGLFFAVIVLLLLQPDFGMTVVVTAIYGSLVFLAGFPLLIMVVLGVFAIALAFGAYFMLDHVRSRVDRFLNPESGDTYQVDKSLQAFENGGLFGTGPGQGHVKLGLPDAHSDFIFAVAGEELGLFFVVLLIAIFVFILIRGIQRIIHSDDMFVVLSVGGLLTMFGFQTLIHMGSSLQLLPAKGMTLPFISYGGSSLWGMAFAMGMVLALTRQHKRRGPVAKTGVGQKHE